MQFLLLISHDDRFIPSERLVDDIHAWGAEMDRRGLRRDGRPLRPPAEAVTVGLCEGERLLTAGPAAPGPDQTASCELIDCAGLEEALEAAAAHRIAVAGAVPALLGDGVRLVSHRDQAPVGLGLVGTSRAGHVTDLRFTVRKA